MTLTKRQKRLMRTCIANLDRLIPFSVETVGFVSLIANPHVAQCYVAFRSKYPRSVIFSLRWCFLGFLGWNVNSIYTILPASHPLLG